MGHPTSAISVFATCDQVGKAVKKVQSCGMDMHSLSIVGKGHGSDDRPAGFYSSGSRIKVWGPSGAFWGGIWGMLFGAAFFWVPGFGPLLVAGPFVNSLLGALEGVALVGNIGALNAALGSIGVPKSDASDYEMDLQMDKILLIANGASVQVDLIYKLLKNFNSAGAAAYDTV
jgi:hypothetical protein